MKLTSLKSIRENQRIPKRVGRGESSGKGKTSGRGMKGQKARGSIKPEFEGGQLPIIKRLPFQRGVGNRRSKRTVTITLDQLDKFGSKRIIDLEALRKDNFLPKSRKAAVKVVATGKLTKPLTVRLPMTIKARVMIEKAKGKIEDV